MAESKSLRRLVRVRQIEEEECKIALETQLDGLRRVEAALTGCRARELRARRMLRTGDVIDRLAAAVEWKAAQKHAVVLLRKRAEAERQSECLRSALLEKRAELRQAEALVESARAELMIEVRKREQQDLDDWHASSRRREGLTGTVHPVRQISTEREEKVRESAADIQL